MIQKPQDLFSYIEVLYFKLRKDSKLREDKYFTFSMVPPEELMPYPSGYNLITIQNEIKNWEYCDQKAFIDFLNSKRTENFLNKLTHTVEEVRNQLLDNPSSLQGMLATWWKLGCHPLQGEDS
jgi:hypothetical protein